MFTKFYSVLYYELTKGKYLLAMSGEGTINGRLLVYLARFLVRLIGRIEREGDGAGGGGGGRKAAGGLEVGRAARRGREPVRASATADRLPPSTDLHLSPLACKLNLLHLTHSHRKIKLFKMLLEAILYRYSNLVILFV